MPGGNSIENTDQHFDRLENWLRLESEAEAQRVANKAALRSAKNAEISGETLLDLVIIDSDPGLGGRYLVTFCKRNRETVLPWNRLKVGSPVLVARYKEAATEHWQGVVSRRLNDQIQIALNQLPEAELFRIDLAADEITRQRCVRAIGNAREARGRLGHLRKVLLGESQPEFNSETEFDPHNPQLNGSQIEAVKLALSARDFAIIHGPPGTGKTTTVVEFIVQAINRGDKVLACAPSNTAVDNLVLKLRHQGANPVRLGHPARVMPELQLLTIDSLASQDPNMRVAQDMMREAAELFRKLDRYTRARPDRDERKAMREEAKQLRRNARLMERQAVEHVLDCADLICSTTTIDDSILGDRVFDTLVVDEACQSTEPPCWIPICRSDKVIFAGDHCQLPPTVLSRDAANAGFDISLMEQLISRFGTSVSRMLETQYRMNNAIMNFSSRQFYDGKLKSHESVAQQSVAEKYLHSDVSRFSEVLKFVDTAGANWSEELEPGGESRRNPKEARFVLSEASIARDVGVPLQDMAIITPYSAQVRLIREMALEYFGGDHQLEVDTVDGFQGREKEIVLISLVRSNDRCEIGFLSDIRRMNVAMTRARCRLMIIGDSATVGGNEFYQQLLNYIEKDGSYSSIWEYNIG